MELASGERIAADAVVVNADLPYAATKLVEPRWRRGTRLSDGALERAKYSCSTFMLHVGLDRRYELPHHLIYLSENARRTDADALEDRTVDLENTPFYVCNPCVTDPSGAPEGHSTLYVLVPRVFNLSHTWLQLGPLRPKVRNPNVRGLYWVGGGTHPGSGLLTIMESANIAADYLSREAGKGPLRDWPYVPPLERAPRRAARL